MKTKLADWASIAEIIAAAAVVLSIVFVGLQISDSNREARAATTQAALDAEMRFQAQVIRYADIFEKVIVGGDHSDKVEVRRAAALYNMSMTMFANQYEMMVSGYMTFPRETFRRAVNLPFYETWRASIGAQSRSQEFLDLADSLRDGPGTK